MGTLDPKLISSELDRVLNQAVARMDQYRHPALSAEAVLEAMLDDADNAGYWLIVEYRDERGLDLDRLTRQARLAAQRRRAQKSDLDFIAADRRKVRLSQDMVIALDAALTIAESDGNAYVKAEDLLHGMAKRRVSTSGILRSHGILPQGVQAPMAVRPAPTRAAAPSTRRSSRRLIDYVADARADNLPPVYMRESLLAEMINALSQRENRHLILRGPDGAGKRSMALMLAACVAEGQGPPGVDKLIVIDEASLIGSPLTAIRSGVQQARGGILFLPHIHRFFGGPIKSAAYYKEVAPEVEKAFVANDPIVICTTSDVEYNERLAGIPNIVEHSQVIQVPETDLRETIEVLRTHKDHLEDTYDIQIAANALPVTASMAQRYLSGTPLPRAAEQLLHRTCARVSLITHIQESDPERDRRVDAEDVTLAISQMTGIPASKLGTDERSRYASMVDHLHERIIGQEEAVQAVSRAVKTARVGLKDPKRPIGSFLFLGPTGVGKSELAKALAEFMFGDENDMLQLDMSEFQDESTINRLIGSPSGYVDAEAGGQLTERVRQQPYIIVLFDEVEKAHARVLDILLQVMEEGRLTDGRGNVANFSETVVIMTSNLGARYLAEPDIVDEAGLVRDDVRENVMNEVNAHFRPEFLNRLSEIVIFHPLNDEHLYKILGLMLRKDQKLAADRGIELTFTEEAKQFMLAQNEHPEWGARPLRRIIERHVRERLADFMLQENPGAGTTIEVGVKDGELHFQTVKAAAS